MPTHNHHEQRNRALKVSRITRLVTEMVGFLGLSPKTDGYLIAELLRGWGDDEWRQAAIDVGSSGASVATRLAVIAHFNAEARRAS